MRSVYIVIILATIAASGCCGPRAKLKVPVDFENLNTRFCYFRPACMWFFPYSCPPCPYYGCRCGPGVPHHPCRHCIARRNAHPMPGESYSWANYRHGTPAGETSPETLPPTDPDATDDDIPLPYSDEGEGPVRGLPPAMVTPE